MSVSMPCWLCRYGRDLAEDDMCRVEQESSMHGTPDASFVTGRTVRSPGRSQSSSQSAWGRGARVRLLAPVQSASPFIYHQARWGRCLSACCRAHKLPGPQGQAAGASAESLASHQAPCQVWVGADI